jgi:hypothetical protein
MGMIILSSTRSLTMRYVTYLVVFAASGYAFAQNGAAQSRVTGQRSLPNSVTLRGDNHAATMQRLRVSRQYALSDLRSHPQAMLGEVKLDFGPMLNNPKALFNIAQRLHALPQSVEVREDGTEISEVDQGLVIHHLLTYRILPGKCADTGARLQLAQAGIGCFTKESPSQHMAEFSMPGNARYVADPSRRQAAIAVFKQKTALADADANKHIADLRKTFADPTQRAALAAQIGAAETTRMSNLNDDQLKEEIINSSVQRVEQTTFVPRMDSSQYAHSTSTLRISPGTLEMAAGQRFLHETIPDNGAANPQYPKLLVIVPSANFHTQKGAGSSNGTTDQATDIDLGTYIYLTGFTLGHDYEWSMEVDTTINWCIVGCSSTYSVKLYAGFNYGFGLRFPILTQLKYHNVVHPNQSAEANLTASFKPIDGSAEQFAETGLESDQIFDGKELVAQVGADAGFNYNLPVVGSGGAGFSVGVDFTSLLPPPYTNGHFTPPAPGTHGIDTPYTFDSIDLLGGLLNFGALGGQVFPAVDINLHSNKLEYTLNDEVWNKQTKVTSTGQTVSVGVDKSRKNDSHFSFGNPVYNLGFTLTPGIDARLFIDVAVWSQNWDWPVWFPQLAVNLPPNGIDFGCHAGTTCVLDFRPEFEAGVTSGLRQQLLSQGCTIQGSMMTCQKIETYQMCLNALATHSLLGIQSCNQGMLPKVEDAADRTLTGGGCQRNQGRSGDYLCPIKGGMLGLCNTMLNNGAVAHCGALVPIQVDQILKRGGCRNLQGQDGAYTCPAGMMGLCNLYVKNQEVQSCKPGN